MLDIKTIHSFISVILNRYNEILSIILCKCEKDGENKVENIPDIKVTVIKGCLNYFIWMWRKTLLFSTEEGTELRVKLKWHASNW